MGNVLKNSQGNVLISNNNAFEISSSIDSNITPGNIKKDVNILGVTGTYEGAGGFRCTNKLMFQGEPIIAGYSSLYTYQYTFDGELDSAAIAMLNIGDGGFDRLIVCETTSSSGTVIVGNITITATDFVFQDKFKEPEYSAPSQRKMISHKLTFTNNYTNSYLEINNSGLLTIYNQYTASSGTAPYIVMIIFKGKDGSYDFDVFIPYLGED